MTDPWVAMARNLEPRQRVAQQVEPVFRSVVDEPWKMADTVPVVVARSGGLCECMGIGNEGCGQRGEVFHHIAGRGGANPHHPDNILHATRRCHVDAHDHPERSYERGVMRKRVR